MEESALTLRLIDLRKPLKTHNLQTYRQVTCL